MSFTVPKNKEAVFIRRSISPELITSCFNSLYASCFNCRKWSINIGRSSNICRRTFDNPTLLGSSMFLSSSNIRTSSGVLLRGFGTSHTMTRLIRALSSRCGVSCPHIMTGANTLSFSISLPDVPLLFCLPSPS